MARPLCVTMFSQSTSHLPQRLRLRKKTKRHYFSYWLLRSDEICFRGDENVKCFLSGRNGWWSETWVVPNVVCWLLWLWLFHSCLYSCAWHLKMCSQWRVNFLQITSAKSLRRERETKHWCALLCLCFPGEWPISRPRRPKRRRKGNCSCWREHCSLSIKSRTASRPNPLIRPVKLKRGRTAPFLEKGNWSCQGWQSACL